MTLYNDDSLKILNQMVENGEKVDCIITDPPYILNSHGYGKSKLANRATAALKDNIEFISNDFNYEEYFELFIKVCKIPNIILFCSNDQLGRTITFFENKGLKVTLLLWQKTNPAPLANGKYVSEIEPILYVHTTGSPWNKEAPYKSKLKCKQYSIMTGKDKIHPTQKPMGLMKELVEVHTTEEMTVLDPFMGSGSTGAACKLLNRNFIGIELNDTFYKKAKERLEEIKTKKDFVFGN